MFFRARAVRHVAQSCKNGSRLAETILPFYDIPLLFFVFPFSSRGWAICSESHQSSPWVQGGGRGGSGGRGGQRGGEVEWVARGERWRAAEREREERARVCIQIGNSFAILRPSHTSRGLRETWRRERWGLWCGMTCLMIEGEEKREEERGRYESRR